MRKLVQEGQERLATTSKITGGLQNVIEYIQKIKGVVDLAIGTIPQAALPWAGVSIGLQILLNPGRATKANLQGIVYVTSRMNWYCALSGSLLDEDELVTSFESVFVELNEAITILYKTLLLYQIKSACYYHQHRGIAVLRGLASLDDWDGDLKEVKKVEVDVEMMLNQYQRENGKNRLRKLQESSIHMEKSLGNIHQDLQTLVNQQKTMWTDSKNEKCLQDLFVVDPRHNMKTIIQNKEELLADVYKWVIHSDEYAAFTDWGDESGFPRCRLLWITGSAGTGKTMLLMGIINELQYQFSSLTPRLSYFFCQATKVNLNNATNALRSLIWLLLFQQPHLIKHIQSDYDQTGRALFENEDAFNALDSIFEKMLEDPCLSPVYFIVDALDECDKGLALLLGLISKSLTLSDRVKWLVSSRPEVLTLDDIRQEVRQLETPHVSRALIELDREKLKDPVNVYIEHKLSSLQGLRGYTDEVLTNISTEVRQRANNLFLWVALVFKELSHVRGWNAVETIQHMPRDLPGIYDRIMDKIESLDGVRHCKNVLVAVSLAFRPLSFPELAVIAGLPAGDDVPQTVIEECGSFLTFTGKSVSLIHQSAKEYLDKNHGFRLRPGGATQGHLDICKRCIDAMSALKENIYGKDLDFNPKDMEIPDPDPLAPTRYACLFWVDHLSNCPFNVDHYDGIHSFLKSHFLHWLEALSLMGNSDQCFQMINKLETLSSSQRELHSLIFDARRFIVKNVFIIEFAPIQLYSSATLFSPRASKIRNLFQKNIGGINILSGLDSDWGRNLQTFNVRYNTVKFSPDGKSLILSGFNSSIQVRNAMTGQVKRTLEGHSEVSAVVLSPNGNMLASGSKDKIRIWNLATGRTERILSHESAVCALAFSPCGNFLASGLNESVWLWDVAGGRVEHRFQAPSEVRIVLFLPNGEKMVALFDDGSTRMWDVLSGQNVRIGGVYGSFFFMLPCLAVSLDGSKLASRDGEKTIQVWDVATWKLEHLLKGHPDKVNAIIFSPGNKLLTGSIDGTIRVWNVATGRAEHTLPTNSQLTGMVLSFDGSRLASYGEKTVLLWNTTTWKNECKLSHGARINSVDFSSDGQRLASVSYSDEFSIWDITTGLAEYAFEGHSSYVWVLAFSPDGYRLVSGSDDTTVRIWNVATGRTERVLPHSGHVYIAAFSPDGSTLASASDDTGIICIWEVATGRIMHTLSTLADHGRPEGYERVVSVFFSPDGLKVAFFLENRGARLWDFATGKLTIIYHDTASAITAFSPDGQMLALSISDHSIQLWNTITGQDQEHITGFTDSVFTLTFSPDGRKLALAFHETVEIWDIAMGRTAFTLDCPGIWTLLFSPDGNKLASGSESTIWVWDLATRRADHVFQGHHTSITTRIFDLDSDAVGFYSMDKTRTWVKRDGIKVLYLPPQFRPRDKKRLAIRGNTIATGNHAGRVTMIQFAEGIKDN